MNKRREEHAVDAITAVEGGTAGTAKIDDAEDDAGETIVLDAEMRQPRG